jgi:hypothetical protein
MEKREFNLFDYIIIGLSIGAIVVVVGCFIGAISIMGHM